ncbi:ATP-binding protein [Lyngbya sp. CCY1209]|uniref:sensor histidine kinase n=1 Tax=Lyngbya sp. CCY1209 TaxID=2886103 RepID=UPI002D2089F7|nr:ATP-binding protein [Lyngbya sp. CCY1209]MEB3883049.1 response regulator [Lyngbya sp. CCY1209]
MNESPSSSRNGDILIVDDQPENLQILFEMLTQNGYEVRRVIDGKQALVAASSEPPDLILLDIMMPFLNGYEVCQLLKSQPQTKDIPVFFLSALNSQEEKIKSFKIGGSDYISKPFHVKEVLARIDHQIAIANQKRQLAKQCDQLEEINQKLTRSNRELEQFASVVAHDLQQPLTSLIAFSQLLKAERGDRWDEREKTYIEGTVEASIRMQRLIRDLLTYCRCDTPDIPLQLTDCNRILEQVLRDLQPEIEAKNAAVSWDILPAAIAEPIQLGQVFQNLIGNALKYRRDDVAPQIHVAASEAGQDWIFCLSDNGIGIPETDFDRIFKIFTRLHANQQYPGTGIGLSICQKIVESYGGKIWVESEVGVGSKFYFSIPKNPEFDPDIN